MARRTSYIQTKQEIKIDKNFSDSLNTMITHIETIDKLRDENKFDEKYKVQLETNTGRGTEYRYITIRFNPNNGRYLLEMVEYLKTFIQIRDKKDEMIDNSYQILYIKEEAYKNKKDTGFIEKKIREIENIKEEYLSLFLELIYEYDNNGENSFFDNPKEECIKLISQKIGSELSAKKLYTMIRNKINIVNKVEEYKKQTSNNKLSSLKNESVGFEKQYKTIIDILKKRMIDSNNEIREFKKKCSENLIEIYNEQEKENEDFNNRFYFSFDGEIVDSFFEEGISPYPMEESSIYYNLTSNQKKLYDEEQELIINKYYNIAEEKIKRSISMIEVLYEQLVEYFDIKLFEDKINRDKKIKKTSTIIKKYYQYKIDNIGKLKHTFDRYIDNRDLRAKKVREIEYLDQFIIKNKDLLENIFYSDRDIIDKDYNVKTQAFYEELGYYHSDQIFPDYLFNSLCERNKDNLNLFKEKIPQFLKVVNFYYYISGRKIEELDFSTNFKSFFERKIDKLMIKNKVESLDSISDNKYNLPF